jgi:hypothetical protein
MLTLGCLVHEIGAATETPRLFSRLDAVYGIRKGHEPEIMVAVAMVTGMAAELVNLFSEPPAGLGGQEIYKQARRTMRMMDGIQQIAIESKDQKRRCWTCQRDRDH